MRTSTLWTWCVPLVLVFAVSATGCDEESERVDQKRASAEQPTEQRGSTLTPTEATDESDETKVVEQREYPPEILNLEFNPSKFVTCGEAIEICAKARDRNGDTVAFSWQQQAGNKPLEPFSVTDSVQTGSEAEECVTLKPNKGFNQIQLIVSQDDGGQGSTADSISFPLHVGDGSC